MSVTIKDIARDCGVDKSAVSLTLRNHPNSLKLRQETREKILASARKLGYQKNLLASSMSSGRTRFVGVLGDFGPRSALQADRQALPGILYAADKLDHTIKIFPDHDLNAAFEKVNGNCVKYLVCLSSEKEKREEIAFLCKKYGIRLVFIFERGLPDYPAISADNFSAAKDAVLRLAALGHRKIAYLGARKTSCYLQDRLNGYLAGLKEAGIPFREEYIDMAEKEIPDVKRLLSLSTGKPPRRFSPFRTLTVFRRRTRH